MPKMPVSWSELDGVGSSRASLWVQSSISESCKQLSCHEYRFPLQIINHAVLLYHQFLYELSRRGRSARPARHHGYLEILRLTVQVFLLVVARNPRVSHRQIGLELTQAQKVVRRNSVCRPHSRCRERVDPSCSQRRTVCGVTPSNLAA